MNKMTFQKLYTKSIMTTFLFLKLTACNVWYTTAVIANILHDVCNKHVLTAQNMRIDIITLNILN